MEDKELIWFSNQQIGPKRSITPEGYLLCRDVPIARIGQMLYVKGEIPLEAGTDGTIVVSRGEDVLFDPVTMDSFNGKPVVVNHPPELVTRATHKIHAVGHAMNTRRGTGIHSDFLVCDLLITKDEGIEALEQGFDKISNGYQAKYRQTAKGRGEQYRIFGNHIAFVKNPRCGSMCAVGDSSDLVIEHLKGTKPMPTLLEQMDKLKEAWQKGDKATLDELMGAMASPAGKAPDSLPSPADQPVSDAGSHRIIVNVHGGQAGGAPAALGAAPAPGAATAPVDPVTGAAAPVVAPGGTVNPGTVTPAALPAGGSDPQMLGLLQQILAALTGGDEEEEEEADPNDNEDAVGDVPPVNPASTKDNAPVVTLDSKGLHDEFQDVMARAEILHPGVQGMTFDAAAAATVTQDSMCTIMRRALKGGYATDSTRILIEPLLSDKTDTDFTKITCDSLSTVFKAASEMKKHQNNKSVPPARTYDAGSKGAPSIKDLQSKIDAFWANQNSGARH